MTKLERRGNITPCISHIITHEKPTIMQITTEYLPFWNIRRRIVWAYNIRSDKRFKNSLSFNSNTSRSRYIYDFCAKYDIETLVNIFTINRLDFITLTISMFSIALAIII